MKLHPTRPSASTSGACSAGAWSSGERTLTTAAEAAEVSVPPFARKWVRLSCRRRVRICSIARQRRRPGTCERRIHAITALLRSQFTGPENAATVAMPLSTVLRGGQARPLRAGAPPSATNNNRRVDPRRCQDARPHCATQSRCTRRPYRPCQKGLTQPAAPCCREFVRSFIERLHPSGLRRGPCPTRSTPAIASRADGRVLSSPRHDRRERR
jgi:hypothetical protein